MFRRQLTFEARCGFPDVGRFQVWIQDLVAGRRDAPEVVAGQVEVHSALLAATRR
jgi:hypothetical protein